MLYNIFLMRHIFSRGFENDNEPRDTEIRSDERFSKSE
jgi:hypothetical protein